MTLVASPPLVTGLLIGAKVEGVGIIACRTPASRTSASRWRAGQAPQESAHRWACWCTASGQHRHGVPFKFTGEINKLTFKLEPRQEAPEPKAEAVPIPAPEPDPIDTATR